METGDYLIGTVGGNLVQTKSTQEYFKKAAVLQCMLYKFTCYLIKCDS